MPGGLTNRNYRVRTKLHDVVVRLSPPSTGMLAVDRDCEYRNSCAAAQAGVGAPVIDYLPGRGVLAVAFIPSETYDEAAVGRNLVKVAAVVRRLHAGPQFVNRFDMFEVQRRYLKIMQDNGFRMPRGYLGLLPQGQRVEAALRAHPEPLVPCHNDLLAANFLDDGHRLWVIDYEYSGNNEPSFELGNIIQESHLGPDHLAVLVEGYYGRTDSVTLARAQLWGMAAAYAWTLWGTIQAGVSEIDYDFSGWAMDKYDRACAAFADPGFDALLDRAAGTP